VAHFDRLIWPLDVNFIQKIQALRPLLLQGENHVVLVDKFVNHQYLPLAEPVIQSGIDGLRRGADARGGVAMDDNVRR
jgi:hypothetical protein